MGKFSTIFSRIAVGLAMLIPMSAMAGEKITLIATIPPLASLVKAVAGDNAEVDVLLSSGDSPHHFHLTPRKRLALEKAQRVYFLHREENYLKPLLSQDAKWVALMDVEGITTRQGHAHESKNGVDMHLWLSPENAKTFTRFVAEDLGRVMPEHKAHFAARARKQEQAIAALSARIRNELGENPQAAYAIYHDSLGYFEDSFHILGSYVITRHPESGLSMKEAEAFKQKLKDKQVKCLIVEPEFNTKSVELMARHYGVSIHSIDNLGTAYGASPEGYLSLLENIATTLKDCMKEKP